MTESAITGTHEVEQTCDRVGMIRQGRLVAEGTIAELLWLRKRPAVWILGGLIALLGFVVGYLISSLLLDWQVLAETGTSTSEVLAELVPAAFVSNTIQGFPLFDFGLMLLLGGLAAGGEYGWDTEATWPSVGGIARGLGAGWLILSVAGPRGGRRDPAVGDVVGGRARAGGVHATRRRGVTPARPRGCSQLPRPRAGRQSGSRTNGARGQERRWHGGR